MTLKNIYQLIIGIVVSMIILFLFFYLMSEIKEDRLELKEYERMEVIETMYYKGTVHTIVKVDSMELYLSPRGGVYRIK